MILVRLQNGPDKTAQTTARRNNQETPPGETINITFTYKGVRCREPLSNLEVTPKNIKYAERTLGEIHNKIEREHSFMQNIFPVLLV